MRTTSLMTFALAAGALVSAAHTGDTVTWNFNATTSGEDVTWMSVDAVDPAAAQYDASWEISSVIANVTWSIVTLNLDVTDQLPPEARIGSGAFAGPAPVTIFSSAVQIPDPPADPDLAATVALSIDAAGFGTFSATDVTLGTTQVDLGPPFGTQTVQINSISVTGTITIDSVTPPVPGDATGDGFVDFDDLLSVLSSWGPCPGGGALCPADFDLDGNVGFTDLVTVLSNWG